MARISKNVSKSTKDKSTNVTTTTSRTSSRKSFVSILSAYSIFTITILLVLISPYIISGFNDNDVKGHFYDSVNGMPMDGDVIATPDFVQFGAVGIDAVKQYVTTLSDIGKVAGDFTNFVTGFFDSSKATIDIGTLQGNYPVYYDVYLDENFNKDTSNGIYWKRTSYNVWTSKYVKLYVEENKYYLETYNWMSAVRTSRVLLTDSDLADLFG